jgi:hypothetical protein
MSLKPFFNPKVIEVPYKFIRKDLEIILNDDKEYKRFCLDFADFFFEKILSEKSFQSFCKYYKNNTSLDIEEKKYLKNALSRVFQNNEHYKGLIGEYLLAFYYRTIIKNILFEHGPKGRSSAEPGIDYIIFTGDEDNLDSIQFIAWEAKTTENSISTRISEINNFFGKNGSFDENIDSEIKAIQEQLNDSSRINMKNFSSEMSIYVLNRTKEFNIGACGIINNTDITPNTFKTFEKCIPELTKEQRRVKIIIFELINILRIDLKEIWNKL